jgi:nucleoside-diphosphate-sugar epimerase
MRAGFVPRRRIEMKVLFIGGTGTISTACTELAARQGVELTLLRRGSQGVDVPSGVRQLRADIENPASVEAALGNEHFDVVVDWIVFTPGQAARDIRLFAGRTRQYIFISSASAYQKPAVDYLITESTPLVNPFWQYSRDKAACEQMFLLAHREKGFPITIVRPSWTYGDRNIPLPLNSSSHPYTIAARMLQGKPVIVPGDGSSLWVMTHNTDFAKGFNGLFGRQQAIGQAFHITSDEAMSWDQHYKALAAALGVEPRLVHISSDFLAACDPQQLGELTGDKSSSVVFDTSKIKRLVPEFRCTTPYAEGIRRSVAWFQADPARQTIDTAADALWDKILTGYERGLQQTLASLAQ